MDAYITDLVAGSPSRNRVVNGNVCMHVDAQIFTGTDDFLSSFARELKKSFRIGLLDENDVVFCGQKILKQGATVTVYPDLRIEDLHEALRPKGKQNLSSDQILLSIEVSLGEYTARCRVGGTYFQADWFCKYDHDNLRERRAIRQRAGQSRGHQ